MPRATGIGTHLSRYEEAWEAINRLIRRGGSWSGHERNCFFVQDASGRFHNASAVHGLDAMEDGRGVAIVDFDRDGDQDIVLKSRNAPQVRIWRNDHARDLSRIQVKLEGTASNRDAVGARLTVEAGGLRRVKEVCAGGGFLSQGSLVLHVGLGRAAAVDRLEVRWPSGRVQEHRGLAVNRRYRIREGDPAPRAEGFEAPSPRDGAKLAAPRAGASAAPGGERAACAPAPSGFWLIDPAPLPPLDLEDLAGRKLSLESFRGRPLLLALWSPECARCLAELEEWSREGAGDRATGDRVAGGPAVVAATLAGRDAAAEVGRRFRVPIALLSQEAGLALGVLLEDAAHWPRDVPVPSGVLADASGLAVRLYRGPVSWKAIAADAASIPAAGAARLRAALPFHGKYYATELRRNDFQLGVSYLEAGLEAHALLAFERALERRPDQPDALYNVGVILSRRGDAEGARRGYEAALELEPDFADARANLGVILAQAGRLDDAAGELARVLELRPDHAEALINLGNVELARGRPEEALRVYARAETIEPEIPQIQKKIGDAFRRLGEGEGARRAYARATRLAPRDPEAWSNLAVLEAEAGNLEEALGYCGRALEIDPGYASAHNNAGLILEAQGKHDEAVTRFRRAMGLAPDLPAPYLNLARALARRGEEREARAVLKRLLDVHPDHAGAAELLRRLKGK
ncbi:MAG: tetratricopeptide repeat protein [Planctomycetes bacterium]|nr:tetratricopeptide repeat protein [Planctomycetota bacterium]